MNKFLDEYRNGSPADVWGLLRSYPSVSTLPKSARRDIWEVVTEAMNRVMQNLKTIAQRLEEQGYEFCDTSNGSRATGSPIFNPSPNAKLLSGWFALEYGCIPSVMKAWIELVGDISLLGQHPDWKTGDLLSDAMVIEFEFQRRGMGIEDVRCEYHKMHDEWFDSVVKHGIFEAGPFHLNFAPDARGKVNATGGTPYRMLFPSNTVDALVEINGECIYFVDYLNHCFQWGGFPGFAAADPGADNEVVASLKDGLLEI